LDQEAEYYAETRSAQIAYEREFLLRALKVVERAVKAHRARLRSKDCGENTFASARNFLTGILSQSAFDELREEVEPQWHGLVRKAYAEINARKGTRDAVEDAASSLKWNISNEKLDEAVKRLAGGDGPWKAAQVLVAGHLGKGTTKVTTATPKTSVWGRVFRKTESE